LAVPARAEKVEQLSPQGYVNDFAKVLDVVSSQKITALCEAVDRQANAQIAVVTIHTLEGDTAQNFANRLFAKWGVGPKGKDRGVLILLAVNNHEYFTEVGYGLEPILPDGKVGGFGRQMLPLLRQGQYGGALLQMTSQVAAVIAQNAGVTLTQAPVLPGPDGTQVQQPQTFHGIPAGLIFPLILLLFFGGWRILAFLLIAAGLMRPRRNYGVRGGGGWWMGPMGGGSGGWGGGGGGFGGFGGGSSGGGGAGGSW
jgi:uncharacterized protein